MNTIELEEKLQKAKATLMMKSPFLAIMCFSLKHRFSNEVPTAGTNGIEVIYNPEYFLSLVFDEQVFLVAHETWHPLLNHFTRKQGRDDQKWNCAGDYVINQHLKEAGFILPKGGLYDMQYKGMFTEQVYDLLPDQPPEDQFTGIDLLPAPAGMSTEELEMEINSKIIQAVQMAEKMEISPGDIPGEVKRLVEDITDPKLPWHVILRNWMHEFVKDDYTWTRPNKRFQPEFYLPIQRSPSIKKLSVVTDVSGSITYREFSDMISEVQGMKDIFVPEEMELILHDTRITNVIDITDSADVSKEEFIGGGGTCIKDVLRHYEEQPPNLVIWFTDLEFSMPASPPDFPIIWICTSKRSKPVPIKWGETIYLDP